MASQTSAAPVELQQLPPSENNEGNRLDMADLSNQSQRDVEILSASSSELETEALPPTDRGRQAYLVLAGCTLIQAPVWGYSLAFGVFQEYYTTQSTIQGSPGSFATVGTSLAGIMYLMMPVSFTLLTRYPQARRYCGPIGLVITAASLVLSSFATQAWQLIASQGVLCAIGSGMLFSPTTLYLDEWFIARKGMAYAVMWSGKSAAGVAMPFLMSQLLESFGSQTALQIWAGILVILTAPLLFFLKPRIPISRNQSTGEPRHRRLSWSFLSLPQFWTLQIGNFIQGMGYFLPTTYLAAYAHLLSQPDWVGTFLVAAFSLASIPGSLVIGAMGDKAAVTQVVWLTSVGSAVAVFVFWGLSAHISLLIVFVLLYGFFAGSFSSTWSGILKEVKARREDTDTGLIFGLLLGGRGLGNVVSGPLSSALLKTQWATSAAKTGTTYGYSSEYGPLIIFTGATAMLGGWAWIWQTMRRIA